MRYSHALKIRSNPAQMLGLAVLAAGLIAAGSARAQATDSAAPTLSQQDQQFLMKAGPSNLAEIQMSKLAMQRGATPAVREFGRWMVTDHTMAYNELGVVTQRLYPAAAKPMLTANQAMQYKKLEGLHGTQFDRAYLQANMKSHVKSIALFKQEADDGQTMLIKGFATNMIPAMQQHLVEIKELMKQP